MAHSLSPGLSSSTIESHFLSSSFSWLHDYKSKRESIPVRCTPPVFLIPLDRDTPRTETPYKEHRTRDTDPPEGTWDQEARQEMTSYRDSPSRAQTDTCKNITLPQTSFAAGKNTSSERELISLSFYWGPWLAFVPKLWPPFLILWPGE